jgi:hypothetical protein
MAVLAERHNGVLTVLLDVVSVRGWGSITQATRQLLNPSYVLSLLGGQLVIHLWLSYVL